MNIIDIGAADNDGNGDPLRDAFRKINNMSAVISRTDTVPGAPSAYDLYIVPASATGAWSGQDDDLAWYNGSTWEFYTPYEGVFVWVQDDDQLVYWNGTAWAAFSSGGGNTYYDLRFGFTTTPVSDEVLDTILVGRELTFPADFTGSIGNVVTNPTATFDLDVKDDGTSIGTISISTGGVFTFTTVSNTEKVVAAGSVLTIVAPTTVDATVEDVAITLLGTAA